MADAVTSQTLVDGERITVMKFTNISDSTGESAVLKVDVSALYGAPSRVKINRLWYDMYGMGLNILWDATTDVTAFVIGHNNSGHMDFRAFGGLINNAGAGVTGDIRFSTIGAATGDTYTIIMELAKS